jgi:predicted dehydrogenase
MKVGVVGFGFMGGMHAQIYDHLASTQLTAIADASPEKARENLKKLGFPTVPVYRSLTKLLREEDVDIIDICLPTDMHLDACLEAIKAGKAVFCEKPLALSAEEADEIVKAAEAASVPFQVGQVIRFWPEYQVLKELVEFGRAGRLLSLAMQRGGARPTYASESWLLNHTRSKGAMLDLHIHDTDFILHLLGEPEAVTTWGTKEPQAGWTHVFTRYHYPDVSVFAEGGWNYPSKWNFKMAFHAVFENGVLDFDSTRVPTLMLTLADDPPQEADFEEPQAGSSRSGAGNISALGGYFNELKYFVECLERGEHPQVATASQAARSVHTVMAELESAETDTTVRLKS